MTEMSLVIHNEILRRLGKTYQNIDPDLSDEIFEECEDLINTLNEDITMLVEKYEEDDRMSN